MAAPEVYETSVDSRTDLSVAPTRIEVAQVITALILVISAIALGAPSPHVDDVWYLDPAINVALSGELRAPTLERLMVPFRSDWFFLNPPFHGWLMGGWLAAFGISSFTVRLFQGTWVLVLAVSLIQVFRHFGLSRHTWWGVLPVLLAFLHSFGLRPEPCGFGLCFLGLALITSASWLRLLTGYVVLGAGILVSVTSLPIALAFWIVITSRQWRDTGWSARYAKRVMLAIAAAVTIVFLLLAWSIRGDFAGMIEQLAAMAKYRGGKVTDALPAILIFFSSALGWKNFAPVYVLFAVATLYYFWRTGGGRRGEGRILLAIVGTLTLALLYRASVAFQLNWIFPLLGLVAIISSDSTGGRSRIVIAGLTVGAFAWSQILPAVSLLAATPPNEDLLKKVKDDATRLSSGMLAVDEYAARFVFDYQWPVGTLSWYHAAPLPAYTPTATSMKPSEVWVASPAVLKTHAPWLAVESPRIKIGPVTFNTLAKNPYEIVVIKKDE